MPFSFLTRNQSHGSHQHAEHGDGDGEQEDIHADSTLARTSLVFSIPHNTLVPVNTTGVLSGHLQHASATTQEATDDDDDDVDDDITDAENANFIDVGISPTSHNGDVERQPLITTPEQWCAVRDNNVDSNNIYIHQGGGEPPKKTTASSGLRRLVAKVTKVFKHIPGVRWCRRRRQRRRTPQPHRSSSYVDANTPIAPATDVPHTFLAGMGPDFSFTVTPLLRIIREKNDPSERCKTIDKVARYKERELVRHGFARLLKGTVLSRPFMLWQMAFLWVLALVVGGLLYSVSRLSGSRGRVVIDVDSLTDVSETLQELVAFVLGFFLTKTVDIWWDLRLKYLQQLFNVIDNMCMRMAIYFPQDTEEDALARETVLRYGLLSLALLFKDAREVDAWTVGEQADLGVNDLSDLISEGLLTEDEASRLNDRGVAARSQLVWVWISSLFTKWCLDGRLPDPFGNQNMMLEYSERARNQIGFILAQLNMQFPLEYEHLVTIMAKILMLTMAFETGMLWGAVWLHDANGTEYTTTLLTAISKSIMLTIMPVLYQGILDIKETITNPFRDGYTDYSFKVFRSRLANECQAFFDAGLYPPYVPVERKTAAVLPPQFLERQISSAMYE